LIVNQIELIKQLLLIAICFVISSYLLLSNLVDISTVFFNCPMMPTYNLVHDLHILPSSEVNMRIY